MNDCILSFPDAQSIPRFKPDLDKFFRRIFYDGSREPTLQVLQDLQFRFLKYIPFENLLLHGYETNPPHPDGVRVRIEPDIIEKKVLEHNRGGYCFELNQYWYLVLRELGYQVTTKMARSLRSLPTETPRSRTHLVPIVTINGVQYMTDVAFATFTPITPIRLDTCDPQSIAYETLRVVSPGPLYPPHHLLLQQLNSRTGIEHEWVNRFAFDLEELSTYADWETANWMVSTYPTMLPVQSALVTIITPTGRCWLIDDKFVHLKFKDNNAYVDNVQDALASPTLEVDYIERRLTSKDEYLRVLEDVFRLPIPPEHADKLKIPGTQW